MTTVSAIISCYNAERFLRGRLDDLLQQTLWASRRLEIVVVNAGSKQFEDRIVREYLARGVDITYIRSLHEPIYQSWNRGISIARGEYLTSANADDRLRPDALERMADALDADPSVDVVYADSIVTSTENPVWGGDYRVSDAEPYRGRLSWPEYEPSDLLRHCYIGPCPVWRTSLHARFGSFDPSYQLAGDYDFWLRLATQGVEMRHILEALSLFYDGGATTTQHQDITHMESRRAVLRWRDRLSA